MPKKRRKLLGKISRVKRAASNIEKQNKKENNEKSKDTMEDSIQEIIMKEPLVPESDSGENSEKSNEKKSARVVEIVGDESILNADFIPLSAKPLQGQASNEIETSPTVETSEAPVTIIVDDDDEEESICVDDSVTSSDNESGNVNDSIQVLKQTGKSSPYKKLSGQGTQCRLHAGQGTPNCMKRKVPLSTAKKRKMDDSIEIVLETIDSVSERPKKKARTDKTFENSSAALSIISNNDDKTPRSHDQDDDIVIVDMIDDNSRDGIKVMDDFIPLKMPHALARGKVGGSRTSHRSHGRNSPPKECGTGVSHSAVFEDTIGIVRGSARYKSPLVPNANDTDTNEKYFNVYGNNVYNPNSVEKTGLRPVIIDGSNVAFGHGGKCFSTRGIEICVNYFVKRGHWVVAFVPLFRRSEVSEADRKILDDLKIKNQLAFTPSRFLHGRRVASYDDRFIVQCAAELGGIVVSTDNYRDLVCENEAWRETIEKRLLMFTWVGDLLMFPDDPNGRGGPRLEEFLRFPQ